MVVLVAEPAIPSQAAVLAAWGKRLQGGRVFAKTAKIHAKCAAASGTLETFIKGQKETSKAYRPGDYIVQGPSGERYCVDGDAFHQRYAHAFEPAQSKPLQAEGFRLYSAIGRVWAHQLGEEECTLSFPAGKFMAAWGEPMVVAQRDWIVTPHPAANEVYRIEVDAFAETYTAVFLPPLASSAAPRADPDAAPDAVLAALGGVGVSLTPPPEPDALPWRWRAEGGPELTAARLAACEAAGAGASVGAGAGAGARLAPGGWGRTSVDGWWAEAAGATLSLELEVAAPMVACRVLSSAAISLEVECELRRDLAEIGTSSRLRPGGAQPSAVGGGSGGGCGGGAVWVCVAACAVGAGEEATLLWADAGAHLRWRLHVASGGPAQVSVLGLCQWRWARPLSPLPPPPADALAALPPAAAACADELCMGDGELMGTPSKVVSSEW
jgi:hypothetical protein